MKIESVIERLQAMSWDSPIKVIVERAQGPVEMLTMAKAPIYTGSRKLDRNRDITEQMIDEIKSDLTRLQEKHPEITHYRVGLFELIGDPTKVIDPITYQPIDRAVVMRYSKFVYTE